jgi:hypothetical protein
MLALICVKPTTSWAAVKVRQALRRNFSGGKAHLCEADDILGRCNREEVRRKSGGSQEEVRRKSGGIACWHSFA